MDNKSIALLLSLIIPLFIAIDILNALNDEYLFNNKVYMIMIIIIIIHYQYCTDLSPFNNDQKKIYVFMRKHLK